MFSVQRSVPVLIVSILITFASVMTPASVFASSCEVPQILLPQDQIRRGEGRVGEAHCYRLDLESPGLLYLDVATDGALPSGARFEFFAMKEPMTGIVQAHTLFRTTVERLLLADAGTYFLEVRAEDPHRPLPAYRLGSRFEGMSQSETNGELELEPEESETNGELELEPEESETNGELELEPEESTTSVELDRIWALLRSMCPAETADDHGDTIACATTLHHQAVGTLENGWGDDADVFGFEVRGWQTVKITLDGDIGIFGSLLDHRGQRLGDVDGQGERFRLVRTLGPGIYFIRVGSVGWEGSYSLDLDRLRH
jgi:hypothetical protein